MNVVLRSTDRVLIESVRIALAAEGIVAVLRDESGAALPFLPIAVLVSDDDFARAQDVVRDLAPTPTPVPVRPLARRVWRLVLAVLILGFIVVCGALLGG